MRRGASSVGLVAAAAADHRDFFFEGGEPVGQVEAGAGRLLGQAGDFLLQRGDGFPVVGAGGGDGGADECPHAVDRQRPGEALAQPLGDARQADAVLVAELFEAGQVGVGRFGRSLGEGLLPHFGRGGAIVADEDFVGHDDGPQVPGDAVVRGPQAEEIDQRVEQLAVVGVRRGRVVVAVLAVVFDDRFDGDREPLGRFVARDALAEFGDEPNLRRVVGPAPGSRARRRRAGAGSRAGCRG